MGLLASFPTNADRCLLRGRNSSSLLKDCVSRFLSIATVESGFNRAAVVKSNWILLFLRSTFQRTEIILRQRTIDLRLRKGGADGCVLRLQSARDSYH